MDMLAVKKAMAYADDVAAGGSGKMREIEQLLSNLGNEDLDGDISFGLLLNAFRQHVWQNEDEALTCEEGTITLTNTLTFPFNNSRTTVSLANRQKDTKYVVIPEVLTVAGNIGDVTVTDKQVNGFKVGYSGGAASVTVKYYVIGGFRE